jgi:hypothetical protein
MRPERVELGGDQRLAPSVAAVFWLQLTGGVGAKVRDGLLKHSTEVPLLSSKKKGLPLLMRFQPSVQGLLKYELKSMLWQRRDVGQVLR